MNPLKWLKQGERDHLIAPHQRGLWNRLKRRWKFRRNKNKEQLDRPMSIFVTTRCNLNCYSCAALGMNPRPEPWDASLHNIQLFLSRMQDVFPEGSYVLLTGGEPTLYQYLESTVDLIHNYRFKASILTNCAVLHHRTFSKLDYLILDYHKINEDKYTKVKKFLDANNIKYESRMKHYHQDIPYAMENNITKGARCSNWMKPITLYKGVVYPCCNAMCAEWWNNTSNIREDLDSAGWEVYNPKLAEVVKKWRYTLPDSFYRFCTLNCWKDAKRAKWVEIT